ncbi:MAG: hypothetical protein KDB87_01620, partial [Flavobacteriales bacterium]|nr:hypothetical protein [Flavobacteriales bacterium]
EGRGPGNLARTLAVVGKEPETPEAMISPKKRYQQLKQEAMRLMRSGDLQHYLHKLRELHEMRRSTPGLRGLAGGAL